MQILDEQIVAFNHNIAIIRAFHVSWVDRIMVRLSTFGLHADWPAFSSEPMPPLLPLLLLRSTEHCAQSNLPPFSCYFHLTSQALFRVVPAANWAAALFVSPGAC